MWVDFRPILIDALKDYKREKFFADLTAGIIVGIVALPLSIALAIASGVNPERGLITAVIGGFLISMLGSVPADAIDKLVFYAGHATTLNPVALLLGGAIILITVYGGRFSSKIPGSLLAILASVVAVRVFDLPVETIGSKFGELSAQISSPSLPQISFSNFRLLLLPAFSMLGSLESLFSAMVADGATGYRHRPNTELIANGIANMVVPVLGGIPACGAIARTMTNIRDGGLMPVAGMINAVVVLMILLFFGKWAKLIPIPVLAGILLVVAYNMSEWRSFKGMFRNTKSDLSVMLATFFLTVLVDITMAIQFGVVLAAFLFVRRVVETSEVAFITSVVEDEASHVSDDQELLDIPKGVEIFQVRGPFFFGVANKFYEAKKQLGRKPKVRNIRMRLVPFIDFSGIKNLESFIHKTRKSNIQIIISGLQDKTHDALQRAGILTMGGNNNICPDIESSLLRVQQFLANRPGQL